MFVDNTQRPLKYTYIILTIIFFIILVCLSAPSAIIGSRLRLTTEGPTLGPTLSPTLGPTPFPTTKTPTKNPTTKTPTKNPTTKVPTKSPTTPT